MRKLYFMTVVLFAMQISFSYLDIGGDTGGGSGPTYISYYGFVTDCECGSFCSSSTGSYDNAYVVSEYCGGCGGSWWSCKPPTGTVTWHCDSGYANCDLDVANGCEININEDPNNCGSCGNVCSSGVCKEGVCLSDEESVRTEKCTSAINPPRNTFELPDYKCSIGSHMWSCTFSYRDCDVYEDNGCEAYVVDDPLNCGTCGNECSGGESGVCDNQQCLDETQYFSSEDARICNDDAKKCSRYYLEKSNVYDFFGDMITYEYRTRGKEYYVYQCDSAYRNCDLDLTNGCEINIANDVSNCGWCGHDCYDNPCSGAEIKEYSSVSAIDSICTTKCYLGICISKTKIGGACTRNIDCESGLKCTVGLPTLSYCSPQNTCPYDENGDHIIEANEFYGEGEEVNIDGEYFICKNIDGVMRWKSFNKVLDLGNLISFNHEGTTTAGAYIGNTGMAKSCSPDTYKSCSYSGPYYAYQFCADVRVSFDGMFSLETGKYVPIYVSEQELYNPYSATSIVLEMNER